METTGAVIVTGAGSGIGRATSLRFAREGFSVIANGRRHEALVETATAARGLTGRIIPVTGDVGMEATAQQLVSEARNAGDFGWLVNNAGVGWNYGLTHPGSMAATRDTTPDHWREVMRINLDSVFLLCHAALPHLCERGGGGIVNVSSGGGLKGMDDAHAYATAKAGIINLTRSMAKTYGRFNVRSNVIAPGFVDTEMVASVLDSAMNPFANEATRYMVSPMGRPGTPDEVADAIFFLTVQATYCNGAVLSIDGGSVA